MKKILFFDDIFQRLTLPDENSLHVWILDLKKKPLSAFYFLSEEEKKRKEKYKDKVTQEVFAKRWTTLRGLVSKYLHLAPADIHFQYEKKGKPYVEGTPLQFSLSHSDDYLALVFSLHDPVGVDIEKIRPFEKMEGMIKSAFSPKEQEYLEEANKEERLLRFWEIWNRKDAALKARGTGIKEDLRKWDTLPRGKEWQFLDKQGVWVQSQQNPPIYTFAVAYIK